MTANAWKLIDNGTVTYRIQMDETLTKKQTVELFEGWRQAGYGWNIKNGKNILIFQREFVNDIEWLDWVKKFPLSVVEYRSRAGTTKKVQLTNRKV